MKKVICTIITTLLLVATTQHVHAQKQVVVYTTLNEIFSEPILQEFEDQHGIKVIAVYDEEMMKSAELFNRLLQEKDTPKCDVFWNDEIVHTIVLKNEGILAPYKSPAARDIPKQFKDGEGYWTGFAARARVIVVNTDLVDAEQFPASFADLTKPEWQGKAAIANPLYGTAGTHISTLYAKLGKEQSSNLFNEIRANNIRVVAGNSVVLDMVGAGQMHWGVANTDNVNTGIMDGMPIKAVLPDQQGDGTLLIPNTLGLIANGPNPREGKQLIDYLLSREIEQRLCLGESAQIPLREDIKEDDSCMNKKDLVSMDVDFEAVADSLAEANKVTQAIFLR